MHYSWYVSCNLRKIERLLIEKDPMRPLLCLLLLSLTASCATVAPEIIEVRVKRKDSRLEAINLPLCLAPTEGMNTLEEQGATLCAQAALYKDRKLATKGEEDCVETKLDWSVWELEGGRYQKKLRIDFKRNGVNLRVMIASFLSASPEFSDASQSTLCGALFYAFGRNEHSMMVPILTSSDQKK